ncbi:hypothetical protein LTR78_007267 [Recurvomyces mirabilis]|uniref:Uncharacterized protein n=1 Tax=Recurvomyces mirabilis TaxID=574656 RepID=A0AAE0WJL2_9PEZI|nr:hypothetical protein LTR78_007267 [Recurvomyces mirabilis]KAK5155490.1 hypothetical protein LTS14_005751 [Recurvomyces mirabilis]
MLAIPRSHTGSDHPFDTIPLDSYKLHRPSVTVRSRRRPSTCAGSQASKSGKVDIKTLLERPGTSSSPGNDSSSSKTSRTSRTRGEESAKTSAASPVLSAVTRPPLSAPPLEPPVQQAPPFSYPPVQMAQYAHYPPPSSACPPMGAYPYPFYPPGAMMDPRLPPPISLPHPGPSNKRLAPPHPAESPAKKKQSKWTVDEDVSITELRGNGMKWEDISKHLPGRSAISCRLRFQNYLERRSEWDEEKKNKLARLYERFKKDMWEKIAKEMQLPWRAAEAMHWQIGEVEMAQRANVPVFHLASGAQPTSQPTPATEPRISRSPPSNTLPAPSATYTQSHSHAYSHPPPQLPRPVQQPMFPAQARLRRNSDDSLPNTSSSIRHRADSARSMPPASHAVHTTLSPLSAGTGPPGALIHTLPPVVTLPESGIR